MFLLCICAFARVTSGADTCCLDAGSVGGEEGRFGAATHTRAPLSADTVGGTEERG